MKRLLIVGILILFLINGINAANYYVSNSGNDNNNGLSEATPWKTISKVNSMTFSPGDNILFKRGDIWREQLNVSSSGNSFPITYGPYGIGEKPIISGAINISGWGIYSGNIFQKNLPRKTYLLMKNKQVLSNGSDRNSLNNQQWVWQGGVLYFRDDSGNPDATQSLIEVGQYSSVINLNNQDNVLIDGLRVYGGQPYNDYFYMLQPNGGIFISRDSDNITVINSLIELIEGEGITVVGGNVVISSNVIKNVYEYNSGRLMYGDGIYVNTNKANIIIFNNSFLNNFGRLAIAVVNLTNNCIISSNLISVNPGFGGIDIEPNPDGFVSNVSIINNNISILNYGDSFGILLYGGQPNSILKGISINNNVINMINPLATRIGINVNNVDDDITYVNNNFVKNSFDGIRILRSNSILVNNTLISNDICLRLYYEGNVSILGNYFEPLYTGFGRCISSQTNGTVNASYNICRGGIEGIVTTQTHYASYYNNILYNKINRSFNLYQGKIILKNNILISNDSDIVFVRTKTGDLLNYNCYYAPNDFSNLFYNNSVSYNDLNSWKTSGHDINSINSDHLFTDATNGNFTPLSNSPVCHASETGSYIGALPCASSSYHPADTNSNGCVEQNELMAYISRWQTNQVTIPNLIEAVGLWIDNVGCS